MNVRQALTTALDELDALRRELEALRQLVRGDNNPEQVLTEAERERKRYEAIASDVETWADRMIGAGGDTDVEWKDIRCTKMLRGRYNADDRTETSLTWMVDSRSGTKEEDTTLWPCLRIRSTIDAPLADVSNYLSQESHSSAYNVLLTDYRRLSTIGPQAQITMAQTPKILFVQPKTFLTFCAYRWRRKGQELVIVNEALNEFTTSRSSSDDDDDKAASVKKVKAKTDATAADTFTATAFCFRGATVLSQDRDDPQKTHICLIAHASPGRDVPTWACRTATQTLAAMEPFQLCYKLNQAVIQAVQAKKRREQQRGGGGQTMHVAEAAVAATAASAAEESKSSSGIRVATDGDDQPMKTAPMETATLVETTVPLDPPQETTILMESTAPPQQPPVDLVVPESKRPVGIAHMGYACFWPNGAEEDGDDEPETQPQAPE